MTPTNDQPTLEQQIIALFEKRKKAKQKQGLTLQFLSEELDKAPRTITRAVAQLVEQGYNINLYDDEYKWDQHVSPGSRGKAVKIHHSMKDYDGGWRKFGACGDQHLGSLHERLDVNHALYDIYAKEGCTEVYNTGNWIEGEARFNFSDIKIHGLDDQIDYFLKHYPQREGITTYFVAGDDHEGWYQQRTRLIIGKHMERKAREIGRHDLVYLGYMEGYLELTTKSGGKSSLLVMHPGGGSAYAESYAMQKIAEAFQEGEKPDVVLAGHYHKMGYGYHRGIHMVQTGTGQDQSTFMRKNRIKAAVGGALIELHQAPEGHINRFKPEFFTFYDRKFYGQNKRKWLG